jgi:hypothetical protein
VVSATNPYGRTLGFLDRSLYFSFQVAPQLYSRGGVDPVPHPLVLRKSGSTGNRTLDLWICSQELCPLDHRGGLEEEEEEVNLRPTISRPVCPGVRCPSGTCDQFFFRLEISCRQLRLCYFVAPSLTRGRVCNLLLNCFWALREQSPLSRSPAELTAIIYCLI